MGERPRCIAHVDMDAFFASVELLRYPQLRGRAVVIGGRGGVPEADGNGALHFTRLRDYSGRGVVTTATYEARAFGVHSGMGLMKAARLAPDAVLLPADFDAYRAQSRRFKVAVARVAPLIEDRGVDELYAELTGLEQPARALADTIRAAVHAATGLTCSVGVGPNKLLAKLGSDLNKPDGVTVLTLDELAERVWPLPASRIGGIGPKATRKLAALGIASIGELAAADPSLLQSHFGRSYAAWLHAVANGIDERPLVTEPQRKSFSRETTFERDLHPRQDREELSARFTALCERLSEDLSRAGRLAGQVGIKLRYDDFRTVTRELTLGRPVNNAPSLRRAAARCLQRVPLQRRLRLLGVRAGALQALDAPEATGLAQAELPLEAPVARDPAC